MVSVTEFSKKIKDKYPQYKDVSDLELATRMVEKYPEYANKVDLKKKDIAIPKEEIPTIQLAPGEELPDQQTPQPVIGAAPAPVSEEKLPQQLRTSGEVAPVPSPSESLLPSEPKPKDKFVLPEGEEIDLNDPLGSLYFRANPLKKKERPTDISTYGPMGPAPLPEADEKQAAKQKEYEEFKAIYETDPTYAISHLSKVTGKTPEQLLATPFAEIDAIARPLNETDKISIQTIKRVKSAQRLSDPNNWLGGKWSAERAAIAYASETDPDKASFIRKYMQPVEVKKPDGTVEKTTIYGNPKEIFKDSEATLGTLVANYLNDPINEAVAMSGPFAAEFQQAKNDLFKNYPKFGAVSVGNKVSQAYEKSGERGYLSRFAQMNTPGLMKEMDQVAKDLLAKGEMSQEEYDVYLNQVRGNEQYLDVPSVVEQIGLGGGAAFSGIKSTFTEPFTPTSESQLEAWEEEASNVSANPKGFWKFANDAAHMAGFVMGMSATGGILKGGQGLTQGLMGTTRALSPTAINMTNAGLVFFGDNLKEGKLKYPNDPAKAITSAVTNTTMFVLLAKDLFPVKQVESALKTVKPEIDAVVNQLTSGAITREAYKAKTRNIFTNTLRTLSAATKQNVKASSEMAGIALLDRGLDNLMGLDKQKYDQYHGRSAELDAFTNMFMGNMGVAAWAGYGKMRYKNRAAIESYYDAAKRPDFYRKVVSEGEGAPESKNEILENIKFAESVKSELEGLGMSESKQKVYIANAMGQKALLAKESVDPNLQKKNQENASEIQKDQEELLNNPGEDIELTDDGFSPIKAGEVAAPKVPQPEQQKESIAKAVKEAGYDVTPEQLDRIYDGVIKGDGKIDANEVRRILNAGYIGANTAAEYINELGIKSGEVAPKVPQPTKAREPQAPIEGEAKINDVIDRTGTYKGQKGRFYLDGQTVIFDVEGSNKEYEIGNIGEIGEKGVSELGVDAEGKVVSTNEAGNVVIRGEEFVNLFSDPAQAINKNKEGEVVSVNLETADGKKRTFRGDVAKDIAAEIESRIPKAAEGEVPAEVAEGAPPVQPAEAPTKAKTPLSIRRYNPTGENEVMVGGDAELAEARIEKIISTSKSVEEARTRIGQTYVFDFNRSKELNDFIQDRIDGKTNTSFQEWRKGETEAKVPQPKQKTIEEQAAEQQAETERLVVGGEAEKNRKSGKYVKDGVEYVRNEQGQGEYSDQKGEVRFTNEVAVPFRYKLVDAETLQPSHSGGVRNPSHFIPEAQPKSRLDKGSIMAEEGFANNPRFDELGENTNAFSGAPVVNQRNEVVQGNNRAAGLKKGYERNNPAYKEALKANATKFGFSPSQVEGMKNPVLVREVAVSDAGAIELGNYDVKDLETGGKRRLDPIAVTRRMPIEAKKRLAELLFGGEGTVNQSLRNNFDRVMEILKPLLNQAQRNTLMNKEGILTEAGAKDIESVGQQLLFDNGDPALPDLFENLSYTQKEGIRKALTHIFAGGSEKNLIREVQNAILGLNDFAASGAKDLNQWMSQTDLLRGGKTPRDIYTPLELKMVEVLSKSNQGEIKLKFQQFEDAIKEKEANMFEPAQKGKSKEEAIKEIFQPEEAPKEAKAPKAEAKAVPKAEEVKAEAPKEAPKEYSSKNLPEASGDFEVVEVIPYTEVEKNKFRPDQQLKYNQGTYEPVRIVGDAELIELIQIGSRESYNLTNSNKKPINRGRQEQLEAKYGISAGKAYRKSKELAKENRGDFENIIIIGKPEAKEAPKVEPKVPRPEIKDGEEVSFKLSTGEKSSGQKVSVPGYENMDFIAVRSKEGMNYEIYELTSGLAIGAEAGTFFSAKEAANRVGEYLASKKITPEKIFGKFLSSESPISSKRLVVNESPEYQKYKSQKQAEAENKPFLHTESERKRLIEIANEAKKEGLDSAYSTITGVANLREGTNLGKMSESRAKKLVDFARQKNKLAQLQKEQKPLPKEDREQRGDTPEAFKEVINSDYERDQYEKIPQSIKNVAQEAFKKQIAIFNKYGYYPKAFTERATDVQIAILKYIRASAARKVETRPERVKKSEKELIETINFVNKKYYEEFGGEKPTEVKTIDTRGGAEVGGEPAGEIPVAEGGKQKGKYTAKAEQIAKEIMKAELPSWLKADLPPGTEKMGIDEGAVKKALANAVIKMGKLLDKGVEFSQAVKEATRNLVKLIGEDKAESIENNFTDFYKDKYAIPKPTTGKVPVQPEARISEKMEGGTPRAEPQKPTQEKGEGKGEKKEISINRKKAFLNAIINAKGTPEAAKEGLKEKGLEYKTSSQKEAAALADSVIDTEGIDAAVELAQNETMDGDVNALIMMRSLEKLSDMESSASSPADKQKYAIRFAEIAETLDDKARSKGRFNSAIAYFYKKSPLGIVISENNKRQQRFDEWASKKEKSWKDFYENVEEMMSDPEIAKIINERILEAIGKEGKPSETKEAKVEVEVAKAGDPLRKFSAAIRKGRISKLGGFRAGTGFDAVWDASLEIFAKSIDGGAKLADAIEAGIKYIRSTGWYANLTNKSDFEDKYRQHLENEYSNQKKADKYLDGLRKKLSGLSAKDRDKVVKKALTKITESGGLDYQDFRDIIGEVTGRGSLTEAQANKMKELVGKTNSIEVAAKRVQEERTAQSIKDYLIAELEAAKAAAELQEIMDTNPNVWDRLTSIMQLNTLGIPALINNPIYNIWNQATVRLPIGVVNTLVDQAISKSLKAVGRNYVPETNIINANVQADFFKKLGFGTKESFTQLLTGLNRQDYIQKELTTQKIKPWESMKSIARAITGKEKLTKAQKLDKALQATVGVPAEIVARVLNLGDKPQRFAAEAATAATFANTLGLKDIDYKIFIEFPREEAYRALRQKGMSESEASQQADYIKESIIKEGKRSTFQQDNILNDMLNSLFSNKGFRGAGNLIKAIAVSPYIKIPANAYWSYYNMVNPEIALLQSMIYGVRSAKVKGNESKMSAREAKYWFGHAVVGVATRAVVLALVQQGVFNAGTDKEETKKEREGKSTFVKQGTIDIDKLQAILRGENPDTITGGVLVPLKYMGHWGTIGNSIAKKHEEMTPEQRQAQLTFWDAAVGGMETDALSELQEGIFSNTSSMLSAFQSDYGLRKFGLNVVNLFTNVVQPAAAAQIERAALPYQSNTKADSFLDEIKNAMLQRSVGLRKILNEQPPAKIGIWGDVLDRKENIGLKLFGISRENKDNFSYPIWELVKKTGDIGYFPPAILPVLDDVELTVEQANKLQILIGQARKARVAPYVNNEAEIEGFNDAEGNPVKFNDLSQENKKFVLNYLYTISREDGVAKFYLDYPELNPYDEFKEEGDYELNARKNMFRVVNRYKGKTEKEIQVMIENRFKK